MFLSDLLNVPYIARNIDPNDTEELEQIKKKLSNPNRPILCLGKEEKRLIRIGKDNSVKVLFDLTNGVNSIFNYLKTESPSLSNMDLVNIKSDGNVLELTGGIKGYIRLKNYKSVEILPVDTEGVKISVHDNVITIIPDEVQTTIIKTIKFRLKEENKLPSDIITLNLKITPLSFTTDMQIVNDDFSTNYVYINNFKF